jgi:thiamine pyrophosphate-dependent acetolactate synthase large subunit-like protein
VTKGSDLLVAALENEGVAYIFATPGEENLDVLESLRRSKIKLVLTRHEQAAGFMAATYGRLTGRAGVCLTTLGPGALNLTTAAAYAHLGAMAMVMITGQKAIRSSRQARFRSSTSSRPCDRSPRWRRRSSPRRVFRLWFATRSGSRSRRAGPGASRTARG